MNAIVHAGVATRWRPTPTILASMALHAAALVACVAGPAGSAEWALGAIVANHAILTVLGVLPRSTLLGPNVTRLPQSAVARHEIALTFDDGPDVEVTHRVNLK